MRRALAILGCALAVAGASGAAAAPPTPAPETRGRALYGQSCATCHGQNGEGSPRGPNLENSGAAAADFQLSTGRMPLPHPGAASERRQPAFGPRDIDALTAYIASLGHGPAIPVVSRGDLQEGREIFVSTCAACHSGSLAGGTLSSGRAAPPLLASTPTQIAEAIRLGPGAMPSFPRGVISDAQVNAIATYVTSLRPQLDHGGAPLGGFGPVPEGAVAWVFGLCLLALFIRLIGKRAP
ncbi:c-type cytochrome [Nonomuraea phyllanthi]|uniref:cytochrome bc1 complex diheme cytochrome c subunit n=1 Tax=Nonomuraea phyllanthi TaxID=2219224 RepID=UPI001292FBA2|nr:c-type cytochrome [Nonomuraea phyllanthi]QFY06590.1 c-type cytochrome [Nonomuraea phyllanthi]